MVGVCIRIPANLEIPVDVGCDDKSMDLAILNNLSIIDVTLITTEDDKLKQ